MCSESWPSSRGWVDCLWSGSFGVETEQKCRMARLGGPVGEARGWGGGLQMLQRPQ